MDLHAGLPTCNRRSCTRWDGADILCIPRFLLHSSMWHTWHAQPCSLRWSPSAIFHDHHEIFWTCGVRSNGFNLPRQHSLPHYTKLISAFGAPNGLCSSITESKHIKAMKEPWRCSNHFEALGQMLLTNQHIDKLAAARVDFADRGMLQGTCLSAAWDEILHMYSLFHFNYIPN